MKSSLPFALSPFAPEYNRVPPGVAPDPNAPPPSFIPPPQPFTALLPSPPPEPYQTPPHLIPQPPSFPYTVVPQPTQSTTVYPLTTVYYHAPHSVSTATITRPPPPPPQRRRGFSGQGRGRGKERRDFRSERGEINNMRDSHSKCARVVPVSNFNAKKNVESSSCSYKWGMQRGEKSRHEVMPLKKEEENTTVMIKNIPYACPRKELMSVLDIFCARENSKSRIEGTSVVAYDFLYLPIDFRTRRSRGFAFVNFTNAGGVWKFFDAFHLGDWGSVEENRKWPKKIEVVCAKIQGKAALANHFSGSIFDCPTDDYLPVIFSPPRDGSGQPGELTVVGRREALFPHREPRTNHRP